MADAEIEVGRIVRPHGLRGWLVVQPASVGSDLLLNLKSIAAERRGRRERLVVRESRRQGKLLLLSFEGCPDRTAAEAWIGTRLLLPESELPPPGPDEFYASRLVGLSVVAPKGDVLGRVVDVESAGAQSWLVVETPSGRHLVPFTEPLVKVEAEAGRVVVDAPEGLLDGSGLA